MSEIRVFNNAVPEGGYPYHAWFVGDVKAENSTREHFFACVTDDFFYLSPGYESTTKRIAQTNRLQQEHPRSVCRGGKSVDLRTVSELRCGKADDRLEFVKDGKVKLAVDDEHSQVCRKIFDDIRGRRAPQAPIEEGVFSAAHSLAAPLCACGLVVLLGGLLIWESTDADPNQQFRGRRAGFMTLVNNLVTTLGIAGTTAVVAAALAACIGWAVYRRKNPVPADIVRLR